MARGRSTSPIVSWIVSAAGLLLIGYLAAVPPCKGDQSDAMGSPGHTAM